MTPKIRHRWPATGPVPGLAWSSLRHEKLRIALYSHDTMGIGHMRRNGLIAAAFSASHFKPNILLICGAREAGYFDPAPGVDYLTLPALGKAGDGSYHSRRLDVELGELVRLRSQVLRAAIETFRPEVLIVDKVPRGALRELDPVLRNLRQNAHTRCVLGLRDVLDDPRIVAEEWARDEGEQAIRDYYEAIWVYGSRDVYDVARRYCWSNDVAEKIRYTGYLRRFHDSQDVHQSVSSRCDVAPPSLPDAPIMLCLVGGGQDGGHVAEAFARAEYPEGAIGVIVTGPFMPPEVSQRLRELALSRRNLRIFDFVPRIDALMRRAQRVVGMGGYNTVCEILALGKPALIIPRTRPRCEQLIRAQNMQSIGLLRCLPPEQLSPHAITQWLASDAAPDPEAFDQIDFGGLERLSMLLGELLLSPPLHAGVQGVIEHVA